MRLRAVCPSSHGRQRLAAEKQRSDLSHRARPCGKETLFNVGLPTWRQVTKRRDRVGLIRIDCDVLHTWMSAVIIVTRTLHFAVSDENGKFVVGQLPAGPYRVEVWHEKLGTQSTRLTVDEHKSVLLRVVYSTRSF
jgi:hypothetical protein